MSSKMKPVFLIAVVIVQSMNYAFSVPMMDLEPLDLVERVGCTDTRDDCHWITDNHYDVPKYCAAHRNDAFIKDCQEYCGFCRAPAPASVHGVCEDTRSDCNWILKQKNPGGYCNEYKNDPEVRKCAKTCGFCHYHRAPAPPRCLDTRPDCDWINKNGENKASYCHRNRNVATVRACARTCGFC